MNAKHNLSELEATATRLRLHVVYMVAPSGQGYVQQGLGAADIFASLYFAEATMDPSNPTWPDRDRVFLATAHNTAIFHATLAERGFFPVEDLKTYVTDGSTLAINSSERMGPFVEATCGSLGQGLSVAIGRALSAKRQGLGSAVAEVLMDEGIGLPFKRVGVQDCFCEGGTTPYLMNKFGLDAPAIAQAVRGVMQRKKG